MQRTPEGGHLVLRVLAQALTGDWDDRFQAGYPCFRPVQTPGARKAEAA